MECAKFSMKYAIHKMQYVRNIQTEFKFRRKESQKSKRRPTSIPALC